MRFCVIGAGAMGGLYGGRLSLAGYDVVFIDTDPDTVTACHGRGLILEGIDREQTINAPVLAQPTEGMTADVALIHTDTNNTRKAAETARTVLADDGFAVTLQNGIGNVETLCDVLGSDRVLGGISYHSAASPEPGRSSHTHDGLTWLGELDGTSTPRLTALAEAITATGMTVEAVDNIMDVIWTKFVHNCSINPISAITGWRVGEIPDSAATNELQTRIIEEIVAVVEAKGLKLTTADTMTHVKNYCRIGKLNRPSMQQHMEAGVQTEIDALNGAIVREGRALGIPTPYNDALTLMIKGRNQQMIATRRGERR
jgi:2-dehydropantoate 2-reductase